MTVLSIAQNISSILVGLSGGLAGAACVSVATMFLFAEFALRPVPDGAFAGGEGMAMLGVGLLTAPIGFFGGVFVALFLWFRSPLGRELKPRTVQRSV